MFNYFLLFVAVAFTVANACVLKQFNNRDIRNTGDIFWFNGGVSVLWICILSAFSLVTNDFELSITSIVFGSIYGVIICMFLLFKNLAVTNGPVALTTLIGSCTFLITTIFGVLYYKQDIKLMQIVGISLIFISLFLCINPKKSTQKLTAKWFLFSLIFFLAGGGVGVIYMMFGKSDAAAEINGMMLCAAIVATVLYFLVGAILNGVQKKSCPKIHKSALIFILLSGIATCTYMRMNLYISTVIPSVVFFPVSNGSVVILSAVFGRILFKEKLTKIQVLGMVIGLAALVITGIA